MASKRNLKKGINALTFELVSECLTYRYFHPDQQQVKVLATMEDIVKKRNELIDKINNPVDKDDYKKNRYFFRGVVKELNQMVTLMDNLA
jgi:hypothetical protein